ncbi:MAG: DUF2490 domain-containing protein [Bacteroidota bacterium]
MNRLKKILIVLLILVPCLGFSQESDLGNWIIYFGNKKLNKKWNWHHEVQYRNYDAVGDLEQLLLRTGIGYNLSENNNNLLFGYGYILSQNYVDPSEEKVDVNEHRIFQQFITRQTFGRTNIQHRYRFEQRWVEDDFRLRFRYFLSLNIPLSNEQMVDKTFYLSMYDEIFLNSEETVFDRNRLYGGLGYKVSSSLRFELGYMNQFLNGFSRDQVNMITFFSF